MQYFLHYRILFFILESVLEKIIYFFLSCLNPWQIFNFWNSISAGIWEFQSLIRAGMIWIPLLKRYRRASPRLEQARRYKLLRKKLPLQTCLWQLPFDCRMELSNMKIFSWCNVLTSMLDSSWAYVVLIVEMSVTDEHPQLLAASILIWD